jgi:alpha-tubulin suppressor-like RCC1 family protein
LTRRSLINLTHVGRILATAVVAITLGCRDDGEPSTAPGPALEVASTTELAFRQVSAGLAHSCGVTTDGDAYCWGNNSSGQLGNGRKNDTTFSSGRARPVRVRGGHTFRQISAGSHHTCGVTTADVAYCWGSNSSGQLGDGTAPIEQLTPVPVAGGLAFRQVSAGYIYTCGVTADDQAYCWGDGRFGQLGTRTLVNRLRPVRVTGGHDFRQVSAGADHSCGVTTADVAYCWGLNDNGELGIGHTTGPDTCSTHPCSRSPGRVVGERAFAEVSTGVGHTCGVTKGNVAFCWGLNHEGQLGVGNLEAGRCSFDPCSDRPIRVAGGLAFRSVEAAGFNSCGVTTDDVAYCWGSNPNGELGVGTGTGPDACSFAPCSTAPARVVGQRAFRQVNAGDYHTCGVTRGNRGFCWGRNHNGELGTGSNSDPWDLCYWGDPCSTRPVAVVAPRD